MAQFMGNDIFRSSQTGAPVVPQGSVSDRLAAMLLGVAPFNTAPQGFQFPGSALAQQLANQSIILNGANPNRVPGSMLNNLPPAAPAAPTPAMGMNPVDREMHRRAMLHRMQAMPSDRAGGR